MGGRGRGGASNNPITIRTSLSSFFVLLSFSSPLSLSLFPKNTRAFARHKGNWPKKKMFYPAGVYRATSPHDVRARLHMASAFYEGIGEKHERNGQNGERGTSSEKEINMRPVHLLAQRIDPPEIFAIFPSGHFHILHPVLSF